ncbi:hypothetical protein BG004_006937, partial [Podila humilis]
MKKRGPRQGYIELLEKRLDKMEQLLQHGPSAVDPEFLESRNLLGSRFRRGNRSASPSGGDDRDKEREHKVRINPEARYFGTTSGYSSQHADYDLENDPLQDPVGPKYSSQATLPGKEKSRNPLYGIKDEVPRKDVLDHLIELYFDSIYFQMPIIHPGTFMRQYREGKVAPNLLNAICAAVARFSNHPDVVTTPAFLAGEPFATNLRGMLVDSIDVPTVSNVQALIFLSMYEYGAARGPRAWMFGGMAVRQAQELGLNREDSSPVFYLKGDWVMRETRRRTFWACFIMDVLASSSSGRPRMMDERDCEVLLPSEDHDWYDERPVVTEMLDDEHDSSSGTDPEHDQASRPLKPKATEESQPYSKEDRGEPLHPNTKDDDSTMHDPSQSASEQPRPDAMEDLAKNLGENVDPAGKPKKQGGSASTTLSSFAYLIRIVAILGKVSQYVNRPRSKKSIPPNEPHSEFSVIDAALASWLKSIPPQLAYSLENGKIVKDKGEGCSIVFMHVIYHTTVVLLHRPILAADRSSFPIDSNFVETSVARCADAASKVSDVLEFVTAFNCPPRVFISAFFAYPVFTTATIHITNAFASDAAVAARARRSLSIHVKILQTMKSYWSMADKFFYIIRDLYSIQSKISSSAPGSVVVPQVVSHNPHAYRKSDDVRGKKPIDLDRSNNKVQSAVPNLSKDENEETEETAVSKETQHGNTSAPKMLVSSKLASISSFLKSDSGLIALWRRATEMQVLDEAKQEKRRLSQTEESSATPDQPVLAIEHKRHPPLSREELEERMRMNDLEIQEINQEFERRFKSRLEQNAGGTSASTVPPPLSSDSRAGLAEASETNVTEKRTKDQEAASDRATKHAKVTKEPSSTKSQAKKGKGREAASPSSTDMSDTSGIAASSPISSSSAGSPYQQDIGAVQTSSTYRHAVILQPAQLQQRDTYIMQPMQIPPTTGPNRPGAAPGTILDSAVDAGTGAGMFAGEDEMQKHLASLFAQQQVNREAHAKTIEMMQNNNIQRQQLLQQQQQQNSHMSSLAFGPP